MDHLTKWVPIQEHCQGSPSNLTFVDNWPGEAPAERDNLKDAIRTAFPNCDDGLSKSLPAESLHDVVFDPAERNNLSGSGELAPVLDDMRTRLDRWMPDTDEPLPRDPVHAKSSC